MNTLIKNESELKKEAYQLLNDLIKIVEQKENNKGNTNLLKNPEFI